MCAESLIPGDLYWARSPKHFDGEPTIVQVSKVFGEEPEYWTLVLLGSDHHVMPSEFEIIAHLQPPTVVSLRHAAE